MSNIQQKKLEVILYLTSFSLTCDREGKRRSTVHSLLLRHYLLLPPPLPAFNFSSNTFAHRTCSYVHSRDTCDT